MTIHIRKATLADAELVADLSRQTFYETFAADNTKEDMQKFMNEQFTREALMEEVGSNGNIFLLAYHKTEVAGYARLRENTTTSPGCAPSLEIARLYAVANMIGKGVGRSLMLACIETAKQMNIKMLWLGVWEKNKRAIDFYTAFGFEKCSEHDFLLGNDLQRDWLMKKTIG